MRYEFNHILGSWEYHHKKTELSNFPFISHIEPTNHCNFRCVFCWSNRSGRPKGFMTRELFRRILDENDHNIYVVGLFFHGEPLLHPDLVYFVRELKMVDARGISLTTNGFLLTPQMSRDLIRSGLSGIDVSYQGVDKEIYEMEQKGGKYETLEGNIRGLIEAKRLLHSNIRVVISVLKTKNASPLILDFVQKWWSEGAEVLVNPVGDEFGMLYGKPHRRSDSFVCPFPWQNLAIMWNGDVFPCCNFEGKPLGNVNEKTVDEIWNDEPYRLLRRQMLFDPQSLPFPCNCCFSPAIHHSFPQGKTQFLRDQQEHSSARLIAKFRRMLA